MIVPWNKMVVVAQYYFQYQWAFPPFNRDLEITEEIELFSEVNYVSVAFVDSDVKVFVVSFLIFLSV